MAKYQTPSEAGQRQTIDEELGIQDVTTIDEAWYPPMEVEVASAVESILEKSQPMDVDPVNGLNHIDFSRSRKVDAVDPFG